MKKILGYTRDGKGKVTGRHLKDVANTVHTFTGGGWTTDQFVIEIYEDIRQDGGHIGMGREKDNLVIEKYGYDQDTASDR